MYNTDFLPQLEEFRIYLFGIGCVDTRAAAKEASERGYMPPADVKMLTCHEDANGEWVPDHVEAPGDLEVDLCSG